MQYYLIEYKDQNIIMKVPEEKVLDIAGSIILNVIFSTDSMRELIKKISRSKMILSRVRNASLNLSTLAEYRFSKN